MSAAIGCVRHTVFAALRIGTANGDLRRARRAATARSRSAPGLSRPKTRRRRSDVPGAVDTAAQSIERGYVRFGRDAGSDGNTRRGWVGTGNADDCRRPPKSRMVLPMMAESLPNFAPRR